MLGLRINAAEGSDKGGREVNHEKTVIKTRSTEIIELQTDAGASGFAVGRRDSRPPEANAREWK